MKQTMKATDRSLQGIENCRVADIGVEAFAECLMEGPNACVHALPFGYCFLCKHPRLDEIIAHTRQVAGDVQGKCQSLN